MFVETTGGRVEGTEVGDVLRFTGLRYGRLSQGRRFDAIAPTTVHSQQDKRPRTAVFPQLPGRLNAIMGSAINEHPQEEDAFLLNVWAPVGSSNLPVLVFIHGGAFITGGGGVRWYDGQRLAARGNMVVVTVNYRIGPIAHLAHGADIDPNLPVGDLTEALRWVKSNIATFGGDPGNLTLGGQSAGAFYSELLASSPTTRDDIRRLFLMSSPGIGAASVAQATELTSDILGGLSWHDARSAPVNELLDSQLQTMISRSRLGVVPMGPMPVATGSVPDWLNKPEKIADEVKVTDALVTFTSDEASSFFHGGAERSITDEQVDGIIGDSDTAGLDGSPYERLVNFTTGQLFADHARAIHRAFVGRGIRSRLREFTVASPIDGLGSGHCFDLPFLFGNREDWADAPMLAGLDDALYVQESSNLQSIVADFVHGR